MTFSFSSDKDPKLLNPLTLAFLGDSVYELLVRSRLVGKEELPPEKLHLSSVSYVKASEQAKLYDVLIELVNEDEQRILKRGRNASSARVPKGATVADYRKATGVEALFGYLYLCGDIIRIEKLFEQILILRGDQL